jgi:outer membrane protein assembly factor BamE (lipoprotein component of BamABCDE complex)
MKLRTTLPALGLALLLVSGCGRVEDVKGYLPDTELITAIQPGVDNRNSVQKTLGRPTFQSEFDQNTWYYVARRTKQWAFFNPQPTQHDVTVVRFDPKGNVTKIEKLGMDQLVDVNPDDDKTPTKGKELTFLQQLFGDIGRFAPGGGQGGPGGQ